MTVEVLRYLSKAERHLNHIYYTVLTSTPKIRQKYISISDEIQDYSSYDSRCRLLTHSEDIMKRIENFDGGTVKIFVQI